MERLSRLASVVTIGILVTLGLGLLYVLRHCVVELDRLCRGDAHELSRGVRHSLGLAVARALVDRHGGMLGHRDASPHGTVMTAEFPADHGDPDAERTRGPMPSSAPSTKWDPPVP